MIAYFARHPVAANLVLFAVIFLGLALIGGIERESLPEFTASQVSVTIAYPGASATDVDEDICMELDDSLSSVNNLTEFECLSVEGVAVATLEMAEGADLGQFYNDISSTVSSINDLPTDSEEPSISILGQTELVALVAISGLDSPEALIRYSDEFASQLAGLPGVATADISGISDREFRITLDQVALRRYSVSARDIANALSARSFKTPLGSVETDGRDVNLRFADSRRTIGELENLIILQNDNGGLVRLFDVASIEMVESVEEDLSMIDRNRAAIITITKNKQDDSIETFAEVEKAIEAETAKYPDPFNISVINNLTEGVEDRIRIVGGNAVQSLILVLIVMCLFFSWREAVWISIALPFSFLGSIFLMSMLGATINMITLVALLMSIGLIMDDSIVIAENIAKWRGKLDPLNAAIQGTREVFPGVVSSFLTTAGVFGPLMFLSGEFGAILKFIPIVLLITLAASLVEAFLILPNHLSHIHRKPGIAEKFSLWDPLGVVQITVQRVLDKIKVSLILPLARLLLQFRYLTLGAVICLFLFSIGLIGSGIIKVIGFPETEGDTIEARVALTTGTPLARTQEVVDQLLDALDRVDARLTPGTVDGKPLIERELVRFNKNDDVKDTGSHTVTLTIDLLTSDERNISADEVMDIWAQEAGPIADLTQINFTQTEQGPGGNDLDVELSAYDLKVLERATDEMRRLLLARDDVTDAYQDFRIGQPEIRLSLSEYGYTLGLTPQSVADQLRGAFTGTETDSFKTGSSTTAVRVEFGKFVSNIETLRNFPVALSDGTLVSLSRIASLVETQTYSQITRRDGAAVARIIGNIDNRVTTSTAISAVALEEIAPLIKAKYPQVDVSIGGATEEQQLAQQSIFTALLTGLFVVYAILAFQFRSYTLPIFIMLSIPFALIGAIFGHMALGIDMSMPSFIGFASLAGVVVNNAILFMTFFETHIKGRDHLGAAIDALDQRFLPVLLSSSTTFVGLLPIIFETSPQTATVVPATVSMAFGLLASMVLVLLVFPSIIGIYFDWADVKKWLASGSKSEFDDHGEEDVETAGVEATSVPAK